MTRVPFRLAILCLILLESAMVQPIQGDASLESKLQTVLDRGIEKNDTHGVSAAIVFPDGSLWTGVSGVSHGSVAMESDMLFGIGSVTKNFVAALALQLVDEGRLSLDDTISEYLPPFPQVDGGITIRQLLNHTSGLYMFWDNEALWEAMKADRSRVWTPEEVLEYIREPYFEPGADWRYSNTNYLLLGMLLEQVTDSRLSKEFRHRFWEQMGLEGYLSIQEEVPANRLAHVYGDDLQFGAREEDLTFKPRASHDSIAFGSAGLFMTAANLARWSQTLLGGEDVLDRESLEEMLRLVPFRPVANMQAYGLGVQRYEHHFASGAEAIGHGGGNIGSATYMVYLPDHKVSIVVMVNAYPTSSIDGITKDLIGVVLRDLGVLGWIPYIPIFPQGVLLGGLLIVLITLGVRLWRRARARSCR